MGDKLAALNALNQVLTLFLPDCVFPNAPPDMLSCSQHASVQSSTKYYFLFISRGSEPIAAFCRIRVESPSS